MKEAIIEGLKEAGRVVVLATIPLLIDSLGKGEIDWGVIAVAGAIALLRFLDKFLHEQEKDGVAGGLTRF
jgi:hypothetical protein